MNVLLVSSSFYPKVDGSTRCVYDHGRALAARGHTVYLVTRGVHIRRAGSFGTNRYEELDGIRIVRTKTMLRSTTGINLDKLRLMFEQIFLILWLQRAVNFDIIHVHGYSACYSAIPCKFLYKTPIVITTHGTELLWPDWVRWKSPYQLRLELWFEKIALSMCDVVIAQSEGVKKYMLQFYGNGLNAKIRIIHTGVDHRKFASFAISNNYKRILFVGALSEIKGVGCLIKAFSKVHTKLPNAELILVGSGPASKKYEQLAVDLRISKDVHFLGPIRDDNRMIELYKEAAIVVLPSNVGGPISCTILEGLSSGRPVISTDVPGGIPDVIDDQVGGLIKREDVDQLARKLFELLSDSVLLETAGANARIRVVQLYTLDSMIDELTLLYSEIGLHIASK